MQLQAVILYIYTPNRPHFAIQQHDLSFAGMGKAANTSRASPNDVVTGVSSTRDLGLGWHATGRLYWASDGAMHAGLEIDIAQPWDWVVCDRRSFIPMETLFS